MKTVIAPRSEVAGLVPYDLPALDLPIVLSANESPYGLPEPVLARVHEIVDKLAFNRYPDPSAWGLRKAIGARFGLPPDHVLVGNGSDELVQDLFIAYGGWGRQALSFAPTFAMYKIEATATGTPIHEAKRDQGDFHIPLERTLEGLRGDSYAMSILCSPNNPTGTVTHRRDIEQMLEASNALLVVDEAYAEFAGSSIVDLVQRHANLVVLRTFSKAFSLAGLRIGYALGQPAAIGPLAKVRLPYSVDSFSQAVALAALDNADLFEKRWEETRSERARLAAALNAKPDTEVYLSAANFLCVRVSDEKALIDRLQTAGILVRDVSDAPRLESCLRVTVGSPAENDAVIAAWPA